MTKLFCNRIPGN